MLIPIDPTLTKPIYLQIAFRLCFARYDESVLVRAAMTLGRLLAERG
jgi:hypothetical protein